MLKYLVTFSFCLHLASSSSINNNICPIPLDGSCRCSEHSEELYSYAYSGTKQGLQVDCSNMTGISLHHDIDSIVKHFNGSKNIYVLQVRDSNLANLRGLPSGLVELKHLTLDNTNIDLEQIRESSEILVSLKSFKVFREKFTEIPEDFFSDLHGLNVLGLNNVGMKAISNDGLEFLEDSLKELSLKENKLRSVPGAVVRLPYLETLDLSDNEIYVIPDDAATSMESGLRSLSRLFLNTINCTCNFGSSEFASWIRSHAINGVTCRHPRWLKGREVSTTPTEDFCNTRSRGSRQDSSVKLQHHITIAALFFIAILTTNCLIFGG